MLGQGQSDDQCHQRDSQQQDQAPVHVRLPK